MSSCSREGGEMAAPTPFHEAGFVEIDDASSELLHRISGERVALSELQKAHPDGHWLLVFRHGAGVVYRNMRKVTTTANMFKCHYWLQDNWVYMSDGVDTSWLESSVLFSVARTLHVDSLLLTPLPMVS
eukprot:3774301-Amphidinium_carterae.3